MAWPWRYSKRSVGEWVHGSIWLLEEFHALQMETLKTVNCESIKGLAPITVLFNSAALLTVALSSPVTSISDLRERIAAGADSCITGALAR